MEGIAKELVLVKELFSQALPVVISGDIFREHFFPTYVLLRNAKREYDAITRIMENQSPSLDELWIIYTPHQSGKFVQFDTRIRDDRVDKFVTFLCRKRDRIIGFPLERFYESIIKAIVYGNREALGLLQSYKMLDPRDKPIVDGVVARLIREVIGEIQLGHKCLITIGAIHKYCCFTVNFDLILPLLQYAKSDKKRLSIIRNAMNIITVTPEEG